MLRSFTIGLVLLSSQLLLAAEASDPFLDLFPQAKKEMTARDVERNAKNIPPAERLSYQSAGFELHSHWPELIKLLQPWLADHPVLTDSEGPLAAIVSRAQLESGHADEASRSLDRLRLLPNSSSLNKAELASLECLLALRKENWEEAQAQLDKTYQALKPQSESSGKAEKNWRQLLVEHRLAGVAAAIKRGKALASGGEIYADWLEADQNGQAAAYQSFAKKYPKTLLAAAATLEEAQLLVNAGKQDAALRLLKKAELQKTPLAAPSLLLQGDALVLDGKLKEASAAYDAVLSTLHQDTSTTEVPEPLRRLLAPKQALHDHGPAWPVWRQRERGTILAPGLSPYATVYLRYDAVIKRSALAAVAGQSALAVELAHSLLAFDPVDRLKADQGHGAGGKCLGYAWTPGPWQIGKFLFDLDAFDDAPPSLRAQLFIATAYYQTYEWKRCLMWTERALEDKALKGFPRDAAHALAAHPSMWIEDYAKVARHAEAVQLRPGQKASRVWWIARAQELTLVSRLKSFEEALPDRLTRLQKMREQARGTIYERDAMEYMFSITADLHQAEQLLTEYIRLFPDDIFIESMKNSLAKRKNQKAIQ